MANSNGWGDGSVNNNIGWGQGANNTIGWGKSQLDSWSGATDIDGGNLPSNSVAPAITGTAQEGQTLTCSTGTWSGSPTYTYQWKRNGNNIGGATSSTYLLVLADVGQNILCTVTATNFVGSATADSNTVVPTSSVDADAQAFITAASITDPTQQSAINTLVVDLKGYGVWTKMKAIYPIVGGTAGTHKWNLKDPRDLDAAFRLTFTNAWTHSSTGMTPNGANTFANTFYNLATNSTTSNVSGGFYSRTNVVNGGATFGALSASLTGLAVTIKNNDQNTYWAVNDSILTGPANIVTDTRGLFVLNKVSLSEKRIYRNGSQISTFTPSSNTAPSLNVYLGARNNNGTAGQYDTRELAFAYLGDTLTNTEVSNMYTAVQAFQTTLSRQV